jgi:hypothetical protein
MAGFCGSIWRASLISSFASRSFPFDANSTQRLNLSFALSSSIGSPLESRFTSLSDGSSRCSSSRMLFSLAAGWIPVKRIEMVKRAMSRAFSIDRLHLQVLRYWHNALGDYPIYTILKSKVHQEVLGVWLAQKAFTSVDFPQSLC